ncbi:MAG: xanthine dehydrogenase family protein molybdopterin-binding subunit [Verrucomicrobiales bacterium]|nr:xanthine dehydrogenase family protein molybdopterin-binding subunit [Verrucomicrobiales bacterium]MCP5526569.1 xanthine dehydrogenase family protein molybdopterin-binding subunit [Verrucomicrobiales bacterium]
MTKQARREADAEMPVGEFADSVEFTFAMDRRRFVQVLGAGLMIAVGPGAALAQERNGGRGGRGAGAAPAAARIHFGEDGRVTVLSGKIEMGQGARTELTQAAAEELRVPVDQVRMILGDTGLAPDDGLTAGSRTTPSTVPAVRQGAAAARELLVDLAAKQWGVPPGSLEVRDGWITENAGGRSLTYADLARGGEVAAAFAQSVPRDIALTPVARWRVMGTSVPRVDRRDLVAGRHQYPSDRTRPGMLYGKILRPPSYGARLLAVDLGPARAMAGVVAVQDGSLVGVAAPTTRRAVEALRAVSATAQWEVRAHPSSREVPGLLRRNAQGGVPPNPFADELARAPKRLRATYHVAYVQHAPMETRSALAEWDQGRLTVWTGTQNPFGYHRELARAFRLSDDAVRVIVPDFGGGFGGKHTGECAIEAARLAQAAGRPVLVRWTREEEFTWAYFRPAAVIDAEATLDADNRLTSWHFINLNSGGSALETPYRAGRTHARFVRSDAPLRQGSYRVLAATANNFARESFMDELAAAAGVDPLDFRLAHLDEPRLRAVLETAANRFRWKQRVTERRDNLGVGLACGTEKGSVVAACAEVLVDAARDRIVVRRVCQVFECGAVVNPDNLVAQIQSCLIMGLGPALREEMRFAGGVMRNAAFSRYHVPRLSDVPELDLHVLDRPDLPSAGAGETPLIAIAPAIANAVFQATGRRIREMPIRLRAAQPE